MVMVDFGEAYTGPSFSPDDIEKRGWVPIPTFTARFSECNKDQVRIDYTREMMPMKLAWAWTIFKAQGQTFNYKVVANLKKARKSMDFLCGNFEGDESQTFWNRWWPHLGSFDSQDSEKGENGPAKTGRDEA
jgi:hypothetical protein